MFRPIKLTLTEPPCDCQYRNLLWNIDDDKSIYVQCDICGGTIWVAYSDLRASIEIEKSNYQFESEEEYLNSLDVKNVSQGGQNIPLDDV